MSTKNGRFRQMITNMRARHQDAKDHPFRTWAVDAFLLYLFAELLNQQSLWRFFRFLFSNPLVFAYNILLVSVPIALAFLFRKRTFVRVVADMVIFLIALTNGIIQVVRVTPFNAADLRIARFAVPLVNNYLPWWALVLIGLGLIGLVVFLIWLWRHTSRRELPAKRWKLAICYAALIFLASVATQVGQMTGLLETHFANMRDAYRNNGVAYCFMCSVFQGGINKPHGYSEPGVSDMVETMGVTESSEETESLPAETEALPSEEPASPAESESAMAPSAGPETDPGEEALRPNIIFVQLESYFDITEWSKVTLSEDPIPVMRSLQAEYPSGLVSVPSVGAGTANTEFEMITGMNLDFFGPGEYPYQTVLQEATCESMPNILRGLGYRSHAVHNHIAPFYDRYTVYSQLGFDDFISIEYMNGLTYNEIGWAKDKVLTGQIIDALQTTEERDYVYCVSVQGHGKYPEEPILEDPAITVESAELTEGQINAATYYVSQLNEMDKFVGDLVKALALTGEPCVCVFYGDHLPTLGIEAEDLTGGTLFQTPYVVWNNCGLEKADADVESFQMSARVQQLIGLHEGLMPQLHQQYTGTDLSKELSEEEQEVLEEQHGLDDMDGDGVFTQNDLYLYRMKLLEYDILYGAHASMGGQAYPASDLKLGLHDIVLSQASAIEGGLVYVYGSRFTTSSVVYDGNKQLTTHYVSPWFLTADTGGKKAGEEMDISVVQYVASFHVPLTSTDTVHVTVARQEEAVETPDVEGDPFYGTTEAESEE